MFRLDSSKEMKFKKAVEELLSSSPAIQIDGVDVNAVINLIMEIKNMGAASVWLAKLANVTPSTLPEFKRDLTATVYGSSLRMEPHERSQILSLAERVSRLHHDAELEVKAASTLSAICSQLKNADELFYQFSDKTRDTWDRVKRKTEASIEYSLLYGAVLEGDTRVVEELLKKGVKPDHSLEEPGELIKLAVDNERIDIIQLLVQYGVDPTIQNIPIQNSVGGWFNYTLLAWAAIHGQFEIIRVLKGTDITSNQHDNILAINPLEWAVYWQRHETVRALLGIGIDPNKRNRFNVLHGTVLYEAAKKGDVKTVEVLLEKGANPMTPCGFLDRETPLKTSEAKAGEGFHKVHQILKKLGVGVDTPKNHIAWLLEKGHPLEELPILLEKPYPELLKALLLQTVENKRSDVLHLILKHHSINILNFLNDSTIIQKIFSCIENDSLTAASIRLSLLENLKCLKPELITQVEDMEKSIRSSIKPTNQAALLDKVYAMNVLHENTLFRETKKITEFQGNFFALLALSDINARLYNEQTLLHIAILNEASLSDLALFLLQGANPNMRDAANKKPIDYLVDIQKKSSNEYMKVHRELLENGIECLFMPEKKELLVNLFSVMDDLLEKSVPQKDIMNDVFNSNYLDHLLIKHNDLLENLPAIIKKPYPGLLKSIFNRALQEGRVDVLNLIVKEYTNEQLNFLKEIDAIQKIELRLEKLKDTLPKQYSELPIIKKLNELNQSNKTGIEPIDPKPSRLYSFFSRIKKAILPKKYTDMSKGGSNKKS